MRGEIRGCRRRGMGFSNLNALSMARFMCRADCWWRRKPLFIQACRARVSMLSLLVTVLLLYYLDGFIPPFTYWIYLGDWGYCFSLWLYSFFHLPFLYSLTYCLSPVVWKRLSTHFLLRPLSMICWHQTDTVLLLGILSLCWLMGAFNPLDLLQASLHLM